MKKLILIFLIANLPWIVGAKTKKDGETKSTTVVVNISKSDRINIQAKNTELTVETWNKDEVEITASVRFDGKMTDRIEEFLDEFEEKVNKNIRSDDGELSIKTDLDFPNRIQIGSKHVGINISYGDELKVNYKIKAPGSNKFIINNSYEEVFLIGTYDDVDFTQYSGELEAENIKEAKINLKYGSATIRSLGEAEMEIYEQELDIESIGSMKFNSKYADVELKKIKNLTIDSYESDLQFGLIGRIEGILKYGEMNIEDKVDWTELTLYEVDIEANEVGDLNLINSKYSKFDIRSVKSIRFDQSYEDETDIQTLGSFKSLNSKYGNHTIDVLTGSFDLKAYEDEVEIDRIEPSCNAITIDGKYIDSSLGLDDVAFVFSADVKYGNVDYDEGEVDVKRYIKEGDQLEVEIRSRLKTDADLQISIKGYEVDVDLDH